MGNLLVVRHGQASLEPGAGGKLSATGRAQARLLGEHWARQQRELHAVFSGPQPRHRETAELAGKAMQDAGRPWPEVVILEELDEYPAEEILARALPALIESDEQVRTLQGKVGQVSGPPERTKDFQRLFEAVMHRWVRGELPLPDQDIETWEEFSARVGRGLDQILDQTSDGTSRNRRNQQVAAFTSGGPVSVAMQRALGLVPETTLQMAWMVRNASFTEFLFSHNRFTLSRFNAFSHLDEPALLTYR